MTARQGSSFSWPIWAHLPQRHNILTWLASPSARYAKSLEKRQKFHLVQAASAVGVDFSISTLTWEYSGRNQRFSRRQKLFSIATRKTLKAMNSWTLSAARQAAF